MIAIIGWPSIIFTFIVVALTLLTQRASRYLVISLANLIFAVLFLGYSSVVLYLMSSLNYFLSRNSGLRSSRYFFIACLILNLIPLIILRLPSSFSWKEIILPLSLLFFSLQQIGVLIDIRRGTAEPPIPFALWLSFSMFFPSLMTGPISRWSELSESLTNPKRFTEERGWNAILLLLQALLKIIVFSLPLMVCVNLFFSNPVAYGPVAAFFIAICFRYSLWADLSAHTDWARALSSLMGIELPPNFNRPFQVLKLSNFWRNWHISLSRWLQDYVFLPVAFGPLRKKLGTRMLISTAVLITFGTFGLWHGLTLSFLVMGIWKGFGVLADEQIHKLEKQFLPKSPLLILFSVIRYVLSFSLFIAIPTLLLKIPLVEFFEIFSLNSGADQKWIQSLVNLFSSMNSPNFGYARLYLLIGAILFWEGLQYKNRNLPLHLAQAEIWSFKTRNQLFLIMILLSILLLVGHFNSELEFIYGR